MEAEHQRVIILGSTGSIGTQALDVIDRHRDRFEVAGLAAGGSHVGLLAEQAASFHVPLVVVSNPQAEEPLRPALTPRAPTPHRFAVDRTRWWHWRVPGLPWCSMASPDP